MAFDDFEGEQTLAILKAGGYGADTALGSTAAVFETDDLKDRSFTGAEVAAIIRDAQVTWEQKIGEKVAELQAEGS